MDIETAKTMTGALGNAITAVRDALECARAMPGPSARSTDALAALEADSAWYRGYVAGHEDTVADGCDGDSPERHELDEIKATLVKVNGGLVAALRERDAYKAVVDALHYGGNVVGGVASLRVLADMLQGSNPHAENARQCWLRAVASALEALPAALGGAPVGCDNCEGGGDDE